MTRRDEVLALALGRAAYSDCAKMADHMAAITLSEFPVSAEAIEGGWSPEESVIAAGGAHAALTSFAETIREKIANLDLLLADGGTS